jgi:hypothetical protein
MKKILLCTIFFIAGCTYYTEKQSEALSQNVYATSDSLNKKRVDLAYYYSNETTKLVKTPKHRIPIQSVYEADKVVKNSPKKGKTAVVLVPDQYKDERVVVVGSADYQALLKNRAINEQLKKDNANLIKDNKNTVDELNHQKEMKDTIIKNAETLQTRVYKLEASNLRKSIAIIVLVGAILGYIWLRASRFLLF